MGVIMVWRRCSWSLCSCGVWCSLNALGEEGHSKIEEDTNTLSRDASHQTPVTRRRSPVTQ